MERFVKRSKTSEKDTPKVKKMKSDSKRSPNWLPGEIRTLISEAAKKKEILFPENGKFVDKPAIEHEWTLISIAVNDSTNHLYKRIGRDCKEKYRKLKQEVKEAAADYNANANPTGGASQEPYLSTSQEEVLSTIQKTQYLGIPGGIDTSKLLLEDLKSSNDNKVNDKILKDRSNHINANALLPSPSSTVVQKTVFVAQLTEDKPRVKKNKFEPPFKKLFTNPSVAIDNVCVPLDPEKTNSLPLSIPVPNKSDVINCLSPSVILSQESTPDSSKITAVSSQLTNSPSESNKLVSQKMISELLLESEFIYGLNSQAQVLLTSVETQTDCLQDVSDKERLFEQQERQICALNRIAESLEKIADRY